MNDKYKQNDVDVDVDVEDVKAYYKFLAYQEFNELKYYEDE